MMSSITCRWLSKYNRFLFIFVECSFKQKQQRVFSSDQIFSPVLAGGLGFLVKRLQLEKKRSATDSHWPWSASVSAHSRMWEEFVSPSYSIIVIVIFMLPLEWVSTGVLWRHISGDEDVLGANQRRVDEDVGDGGRGWRGCGGERSSQG